MKTPYDNSDSPPDAQEQASAQDSGTVSAAPSPPEQADATSNPAAKNGSHRSDKPPGGQIGNGNNRKHGHRGHNGSTLCKQGGPLAHEYLLVSGDVNRVLSELEALHPDWPIIGGELQLPAAADVLVMQYRRACERDRVAARLLREGKDLKGNDLDHNQQMQQRDAQASATKAMEVALEKLGLGLTGQDPWLIPASYRLPLPADSQQAPDPASDALEPPAASDAQQDEPDDGERWTTWTSKR